MDFAMMIENLAYLWTPEVFALLTALAVTLLWLSFRPLGSTAAVQGRLHNYLEGEDVIELDEISRPFTSRVLRPLFRQVLGFFSRLTPRRNVDETELMLTYAGRPGALSARDFFGLQLMLALSMVVVYIMFSANDSAAVQLRNGAGLFLLGYILPSYWLRRRARSRREEAFRALPDALDMMTIGVEAGLAFESAMLRVSDKWDNVLSRELRRAVAEMRVGAPREVALERLAARLGVLEITTFVTVLIQSNQLGMSIAQVLHQQADEMRTKRRQRAEEKARQAGGKMVFPLVLFFIPSLFIVIIGPLLPEMIETARSVVGSIVQ